MRGSLMMLKEVRQIYFCNMCQRGCYASDLDKSGYCKSCELDYITRQIPNRSKRQMIETYTDQITPVQVRLGQIGRAWCLDITYQCPEKISHKCFVFDSRLDAEQEMDCIKDEFPECLTIRVMEVE
jgi:hypothetical protein